MISIIPRRILLTKKCKRCGLRYPRKEMECAHCTGLSDSEVEALKDQYQREHAGNANLGKLFLYIAVVMIIALVLLAI